MSRASPFWSWLRPSAAPASVAPDPRRLLLLGHSHLIALREGHQIQKQQGVQDLPEARFLLMLDEAVTPNVRGGENGIELVPALRERIEAGMAGDGAPATGIVDCVSGNEYHAIGLVNHERPFDFVLPERPDLPLEPGSEIIPHDLVRRRVSDSMGYAVAILDALRRFTTLPMWHVQSPPPIPDNGFIRAHPQMFHEMIEKHGVAPPATRLKLWLLQSCLYAEACAERGIAFLATPAETLDEAGFLRPEYWSPDPTHANPRFGEAVLRQIRQCCVERRMEGAA